jgi:hypothetical protein
VIAPFSVPPPENVEPKIFQIVEVEKSNFSKPTGFVVQTPVKTSESIAVVRN